MGWEHVSDESKRLRVKRRLERSVGDNTGQVRYPICQRPLFVVLTARGPEWRCGCEEAKRRKLAAAA